MSSGSDITEGKIKKARLPSDTAYAADLDAKAPLASPAFTGTPTGITKAHVGLSNVDNTSDANKPVGATMGTPTATGSNGTATSGTTEIRDAVLGNYAFTAVAGVRYRVLIDGLLSNGSVVGDTFQVNIRNGGTSTPTAASPLVASARAFIPAVDGLGQALIPLAKTFAPGAGLVTLSLFAVRLAGTGVFTPTSSAAGRELYVVNVGPS